MRSVFHLFMVLTFTSVGATAIANDRPRAAMHVALEALSPSTSAEVRDLIVDRRVETFENPDRFYRDAVSKLYARNVAVSLREALAALAAGEEIKVRVRLDDVMRAVLRIYQLEGEDDRGRAAALTSFALNGLLLTTSVTAFSALLASVATDQEALSDLGQGLGFVSTSLLLLSTTTMNAKAVFPGTLDLVRWWRRDKLLRTFWSFVAEKLAEDSNEPIAFTATRSTPSAESLREFARLLHASFSPNRLAAACEILLEESPLTALMDRITRTSVEPAPAL